MLPEELSNANELMDQAKFGEALEIVTNFEKGESISPEDQLSALLIKGNIYFYTQQLEKCVKISERAYQMSQDLGLVFESIQALIGKATVAFIGGLDKASAYVLDAERRLNSLAEESSTKMLRRDLLFIKSWILFFKANLNGAAELAQESLKLTKEQKHGNKLELAGTFLLSGYINLYQENRTKALDYAMKSLEYSRDLNHAVAIAGCYSLIARIYMLEGDYDQGLKYCKQSLSIKEISKRGKLNVVENLAQIYYVKSEIRRSLKYRQQAIVLAEELNTTDLLVNDLLAMGITYLNKQEFKKSVEYLERCISLSEKLGFIVQNAMSLYFLVIAYIWDDSREIANRYFSRLSILFDQTKDKGDIDISIWYLASKAYMMKTSTRMRDRMEAQALFKELIDFASTRPDFREGLIFCIGNLCDLLLEELSTSNDQEVINEILPLIAKSLDIAEKARNYRWLAETKLLQGKLALIRENFDGAKQFLTQAQRIAELHGLHLLAHEVSEEHDKLIIQLHDWDKLRKNNAPMAERIKLASTNDVLERMQGKRAVEPPELVDEEPILLLIMDNSGTTYFNHPFVANWDYNDLFSSFMSAFNTFIDEIFSKSIDRIRVGENTILINPVEPFLACYVIKGQSYPALQKLTQFTETIKENSEIWHALNKSVKTNEILELDNPPALKTVIDEIFNSPHLLESHE